MPMPLGHRKHPYHRPTLGRLTRQVRTARGWSQSYLAGIIGSDKGSLSRLEHGQEGLPDDQLRRLLETITDPTAGASFTRHDLVANVPGVAVTWASIERPAPPPFAFSASASHRPEGITEQRLTATRPAETHEQLVEVLTEQANWPGAALHSLLAAELAMNRGDWSSWTRYILSAGHNEMNLSRFELAASRFQAILDKSPYEVGKRARAEAFIRLGWLHQRHEEYDQAKQLLTSGFVLARDLAALQDTEGLVEDALHLLGRSYVDWGIATGNPDLVKDGAALLGQAYDAAQRRGKIASMGYSLLRQTPFLLLSDSKAATRRLDESASLIEDLPTAPGHINLYRARLLRARNPKLALNRLEQASDDFYSPPFYPHGLATVFRERGQIHLDIARSKDDYKTALQYALASAALHPHGQSLETLRRAVRWASARLGPRAHEFPKYREELVERLLQMEEGPFTVLQRLDEHAVQRLVRDFSRIRQTLSQP